MESLNMNNLARSLPSSAIVRAEQDTMDKFKAAAQSLTLLYRSATHASKRHFDAGYSAALEDLLSVIQHGVSVGPDVRQVSEGDGSRSTNGEGMTIGRVMDWIEARQEALRVAAKETEEDEDDRDGKKSSAGPASSNAPTKVASDVRNTSERPTPTLQVHSPSPPQSTEAVLSRSSARVIKASRSPPPSSPSSSPTVTHAPMRSQTRTSKHRPSHPYPLHSSAAPNSNATIACSNGSTSTVASALGAKRRHAAMLLDSAVPSTVSIAPPDCNGYSASTLESSYENTHATTVAAGTNTTSNGKRKIRGLRSSNITRNGGESTESGAYGNASATNMDITMDFEDEGGRERKRVSRR